MTRFVPPRPAEAPEGRPTLKQRIALVRSGLGAFREGSYGLKLGRHSLRALPLLRKRWNYTVRDPELVREVLVKRSGEFPKGSLMPLMLKPLIGYSIFVSNGEIWERQRRLVDPALEQTRVREVFARMLEAADLSVARLEAEADTGEPVRVDLEMTRFAADVIFRTIFSEPIDEETAERVIAAFEVFQGLAYAHGMMRLVRIPIPLMPGWLRSMRAARLIRKAIDKPLKRRLAAIAAGEPTPDNDILASLIGGVDPVTGTRFTSGELLDHIAMLFLAGHETSASAQGWSLYLMGECPHVQERVHREAAAVLGDGPPAFEHMKKLAFTRDVFREAMRLYPPVAFLARECPAGGKLGPRQVEKGAGVMVSPWLNHRQGERWPDPHAFDPDRFTTPEGRAAAATCWFPFSMGPRVCPGAAFALQEGVLVLSMLARRLRFEADPAWTPEPIARLTLRSANGIRLRVWSRTEAAPAREVRQAAEIGLSDEKTVQLESN